MNELIRVRQRPAGFFIVSRTGCYGVEGPKPCSGAFQASVTGVDVRSVDDPKKIPCNNGTNGDWYEKGTNHRVINGNIHRDMEQRIVWAVICDDLYWLLKSIGQSVTVSPTSFVNPDFPEITIGD